jgi:DNA-binding MarR family transcriptional regulator
MDRERATDTTTIDSITPWLDDREQASWRTFISTHGDLMGALEADLAVTGLTLGDYQVLVYLSEADDQAMRMCDLAAALQLTPSGLTRRLDGMVSAGWVERRPSHSDRRVMLAGLTVAGRRCLAQAAPVHVASVRTRLFDVIDDGDVEALGAIFAKVRAALDS